MSRKEIKEVLTALDKVENRVRFLVPFTCDLLDLGEAFINSTASEFTSALLTLTLSLKSLSGEVLELQEKIAPAPTNTTETGKGKEQVPASGNTTERSKKPSEVATSSEVVEGEPEASEEHITTDPATPSKSEGDLEKEASDLGVVIDGKRKFLVIDGKRKFLSPEKLVPYVIDLTVERPEKKQKVQA